MIQLLTSLVSHAFALAVYPGLVVTAAFGVVAELVWTLVSGVRAGTPAALRRRPTPVVATVAVCSAVTAVQVAAPFNAVPTIERSVVIAAVALGLTAWAELALTVEHVPEPALTLVVQFCWLLAVLGPAVQPENLQPQVLGNILVPALLPVKLACGFLYLLCLPALLRLWPVSARADRRAVQRFDLVRTLCWFPYAALFTTLFFPPSHNDLAGLARFFGITALVTLVTMLAAFVLERRGAAVARGLYARIVPPYAGVVLAVVVATSLLMR